MTDTSRLRSGPWWRDAVIYQVYIRSFADDNGDGVGDLPGIRSRLPYLRDLGVDAIWVTPFYPSPMADGGYDVADYRDIEPIFGTLADADALVTDAHAAGIRVLIDIVPNHTSHRHAWFQAALAAGPGSRERRRYLFRAGRGADGTQPPNDWLSTFGGPAWERVPDGEWYLHLFAPEQPDLDWTNPEVVEEFHSILRFWLDRGVDGFRIDVAHGLAKAPGLPDLGEGAEEVLEPTKRVNHPFWDRDDVHEVYRGWREVLDAYPGERVLVGEAWVANPERLARYVRPGQLHTVFNFDFLKCDWDVEHMRTVVDRCRAAAAAVGAPTTWVLENHDVRRVVTRYGDGDVGLARARAGALLMFALPGGAYLYQGQELGLAEVLDLPEELLADPVWKRSGHTMRGRDGCRVPIPWRLEGPSYGFGPAGAWLPQPASWGKLSVEAQTGAPGSTLELIHDALRVRRAEPALGEGDMRWGAAPAGVLVVEREPGFACAVNLGTTVAPLPAHQSVLLRSGPLEGELLPPNTAVWLRTAGS